MKFLSVCLGLGFSSQSTIFQSCRDGATAFCVFPVLLREVTVSFSRTQYGNLSEDQTPDLSLQSRTLYHKATAHPIDEVVAQL